MVIQSHTFYFSYLKTLFEFPPLIPSCFLKAECAIHVERSINSDVRFFAITVGRLGSLTLRLLVGRRQTVRWWWGGGVGRGAGDGRVTIEESSELRDTPADFSPPRCLTRGTLQFCRRGRRRRLSFHRLVPLLLVTFHIFRFIFRYQR